MPGPLSNIRHERFCQEVFSGKSQAEAYRLAGFKTTAAGSQANAARLIVTDRVAARLAELRAALADKYEVTADRVVRELATLGFSNMADYLPFMHTGDVETLDRDKTAAITELQVETYMEGKGEDAQAIKRVKFKLADKRAALVDLGKIVGVFRDGADIQIPVTFNILNGPSIG